MADDAKVNPEPARTPLRTVVDLSKGESAEVELSNGETVTVELRNLKETCDTRREAIRSVVLRVKVNGEQIELPSAGYHLPRRVGSVQIDCPYTKGYQRKLDDRWALDEDARLRLWPADSKWIEPGTFAYPARQRWFATDTQMGHEPCFVDGGEAAGRDRVNYHNGLDIGGAEGMVDVLASTSGVVLAAGEQAVPNAGDFHVKPRADRVWLLDDRGWAHFFSHLFSIDATVRVGGTVATGEKIGVLGKEGSSTGWGHLHFGVWAKQPTGRWGTEEAYPYLWQSYVSEYDPPLLAVARPHHLLKPGETALLDGSRSWARDPGGIRRYQWTFTDRTTACGPQVEREYGDVGIYSEILKVTDSQGRVDYDFAVVQVYAGREPDQGPAGVQAAYAPTFGIRPGDPVTFLVRSFNTGEGKAVWNFGDRSAPVFVQSNGNHDKHDPAAYARIIHKYDTPGHHIACVARLNEFGAETFAHVHVRVGLD